MLVTSTGYAYWSIQQIGGPEVYAWDCSVAVAVDDTPHVVFYHKNSYPDGDLKYASRSQGQWFIMTVDDDLNAGDGCSIVLDGADTPHVSYKSFDGQEGALKHAVWNGSYWIKNVVDDAKPSWPTSIAMDSQGNPRIAYRYDGDSNRLRYAEWDGTAWVLETVDYNFSLHLSLDLDALDRPHIGYESTTGLKYAVKTDDQWQIESLGDMSTGYCALSLDPDGNPSISFPYGPLAEITYTWKNGDVWESEQLGSDYQFSSDLEMDSQGYPHICCNQRNQDQIILVHLFWDGLQWHSETVDIRSAGRIDLELNEFDEPRICYFDSSECSMHYAESMPGPSPTPTTTPPSPTPTPESPWHSSSIGAGDGRVWVGQSGTQIICLWEAGNHAVYRVFDGVSWLQPAVVQGTYSQLELLSNQEGVLGLIVENENALSYMEWTGEHWAEPETVIDLIEPGYKAQMSRTGEIGVIGCELQTTESHHFNPAGTCSATKTYSSYDPSKWLWNPDTGEITVDVLGEGGWGDPDYYHDFQSQPGCEIEWFSETCSFTQYLPNVVLGLFDDNSELIETESTLLTHEMWTAYFYYHDRYDYCKCIWDNYEYECPDSLPDGMPDTVPGNNPIRFMDGTHSTDDIYGLSETEYIKLVAGDDYVSIEAPGSACQMIFGSAQSPAMTHVPEGDFLLVFQRFGVIESYLTDSLRSGWTKQDDITYGMESTELDCCPDGDGHYWVIYRNGSDVRIASDNSTSFPTPGPTGTPTPSPAFTATPTQPMTLTPTLHPTITVTPPPSMTSTPTPVNSPQSTYTSRPTKTPTATITPDQYPAVVSLEMNNTRYSAAEFFDTSVHIQNSANYVIQFTAYVVLEVYGSFYFYPSWTQDPEGFDNGLGAHDDMTRTILSTWLPDPLPAGGPFTFWSVIVHRTSGNQMSNIDMKVFYFE
jgi:hypothetical protein